MRRPRDAFLLALLVVAGLWFLRPDVPTITPEEADQHAGRIVHLHGVVVDVRAWDGGGALRIGHDGHAIEARMEGPLPPLGAWIEATGDLRRDGGLTLWSDTWRTVAAPVAQRIPLPVIAAAPGDWTDRHVRTWGNIEGEHMSQDGIHIRLGDGPRMAGGVEVAGAIAYDARCVCHVLHIAEIRPWTP